MKKALWAAVVAAVAVLAWGFLNPNWAVFVSLVCVAQTMFIASWPSNEISDRAMIAYDVASLAHIPAAYYFCRGWVAVVVTIYVVVGLAVWVPVLRYRWQHYHSLRIPRWERQRWWNN